MITVKDVAGCYDLRGLSTDKKPVKNVTNGSTFLEMDTSKVYIFDKENETWRELE